MRRHIAVPLFAVGAALALAPISAAHADPPANLTAPTVYYYNHTTPGADPQEGFSVTGTGCIGTGGTPGTANVMITDSAGTARTASGAAAANGSWEVNVQGGPVAPGTATVLATCDIYDTSVPYPAVTFDVPAPLPDLNATLSADQSTLIISGAGCVSGTGAPGTVDYSGTRPGGVPIEGTTPADANGAWSVSYPAVLGDYSFAAVCETAQWEYAYDPISFEVYNTATGPSQRGGGSGTVPAGTGKKGSGGLAATGADVGPLAATAGALLLSGFALSFAGRRRSKI